MAGKGIILASLVSAICFVSCTNSDRTNSKATTEDTLSNSKEKDMQSYISMFEIPATDISRAINFYQALLDIKIEKMDVEGMQMGIFPYEGQMVTGVIIQADGYKPSADGVTMYLNAGENLQIVLDKVEKSGGQTLVPKTAHADESGYFAIFLDSEGNKMALNSPN
ncbi:MAG: VOC family protein [Bacteroidota bacterium]|uniref:VOC family protein n=1 Tax=Flagellimonas profundi TaxID=2915620 RepID=A0ABS3FCE8_9FLAO|nr:VOC family protein [Allomuricauda profundi]MBO0340832.1 VOC family protein [Allomuricauda profundi]MEC7771998.1 VOC family protein [Bacteroidota bacterium]